MKILIADDEKGIRMTLADDLSDAGHQVKAVENGAEALLELEKGNYHALISDIVMPKLNGLELLEKAMALDPDLFVIMVTGNSSDQRNQKAVELGANYYIEKPFHNDQILLLIREAEEKRLLAQKAREVSGFQNLVGTSAGMKNLFELIETIADNDFDILITGENGTGKEVLARTIHRNSPRAQGPFIPVHCALFSEALIEDELFGHETGAYTGAQGSRKGRFERAQGGSVFLDDIDDVPLSTQVKLLRVLQEREIERLGGSSPQPIDVRVIAATKKDLAHQVKQQKFREDLFYRLNVIPLNIPPLRERTSDIALLATHFIEKHGKGKHYELDQRSHKMLEERPWPGNVRELENAIKRAIALSGKQSILKPEHFLYHQDSNMALPQALGEDITQTQDILPLKDLLERVERDYLLKVLKHTNGAKAQSAKLLGISRKNLWEKMRKYQIDDNA